MQIWIRNDSPKATVNEKKLQARARKTLSALGCEQAEVSLWLCDDAAICDLHREYFGIDTPTNVISFAQREGEYADVEPELLGDIVISYETAARDGDEAGHGIDDETTFLFIHGLLHLLGFDHEGDQAHRAPEMEAREEELFRMILASDEGSDNMAAEVDKP